VLNSGLAVAVVGILVVGGLFAYQIYVDRQRAEAANPAMRVVSSIREQVRQSPNDAILRVRLGEALGAAGRFDDAIEQFNAALQIDPEHIGAYLDLGIVAMLTGNYPDAVSYFERVAELTDSTQFRNVDERRERAFYNLGLIAIEEERYEDAVGYLKEALRIRKSVSDSYYQLARAYQGLENPMGAIDNLEIALAFDPKYAEAHYLMGQLYMELDDPINASVHFYRAAQIKPDAEPPQEALAALGPAEEWADRAREALEAKRLDEATEEILVARNLDPENAAYAELHGDILLASGDSAAARAVYEAALELDPESTEIRSKLDRLGS
jgi:tetratricopeptide (TPR) repeat protein